MQTADQVLAQQTARVALHEAIDDLVHDMEALSRHADFVQISSIKATAARLLNLSRENNAEAQRFATAHLVAG